MRHYYALIHKDADSAFGIQFPDIPGLFSAADAEGDIATNAAEALQFWFEGQAESIEPAGLEDLLQRADVQSALAEGAFFVCLSCHCRAARAGREIVC